MSDENNNGRKPLTLKPRTGGSVSSGTVKQSFSHGRTKTVVVETKRARQHGAPSGNLAAPSARENRGFDPAPRPAAPQQGQRPAAQPNDGLSPEERAARQRVIETARAQQAQAEADRQARARAEAAAAPAPVA
ncbi:MAG: IF-2-associated domain-containing protein, partial [Alphaproteobacteria bacterium]|nr:IF-2-associated domain-containing protein [Alphaproteobacteria bacterium]MBU1516264.1 IF-2-associated domain-containing protein [Alphaproteobacteria bacterium]MBU2306523.1 IF-2-associated domain-containing protein [Alphaproteobacteria bacterium]